VTEALDALDAIDAENPWPGLASFREADRELFFGREQETEELFRLVLRERLTVLFGLSGLGKTSLLQAGLFPRLREENVLPVLIRLEHSEGSPSCTEQIQAAISRSAAAAGAEMPVLRPGETIWEYFHRQGNDFWSARNRPLVPLLVFDQFEEIFTLGSGKAATAELVETLTSLSEGHPPAAVKARLDENPAEAKEFSFGRHSYKLLLSLREDFLPDLESLRDRIRAIGNNRLRVRRMNGENALRVVSLPGRGLIEAGVAEEVVRFVAGEDLEKQSTQSIPTIPLAELEIEPALLSIVCRELNNKRRSRGEAQITAGLLEGSRTEILTDLYERSLADLGPEVRSFVEERLLTVSGFRDNVALENALATPGVARAEIDRLTERRLLRIEDRGNGQRLELTHDVLAGVVRNSRDSRRQREAEARAEVVRREAEEREIKMRRELRRSRRALAVFAVLLVGVAVLSLRVYALRTKAKNALAASNVERAFNLEAAHPQQALASLADALRQDPGNLGARALLFDILLTRSWLLPVQETIHPDTAYIYVAPEGATYAVLTKSGTVQLQDVAGRRPVGPPLRNQDRIIDMHYSADGLRLATFSDTETRIWNTRTGQSVAAPFVNLHSSDSCFDVDCKLLRQDLGAAFLIVDTATGKPAGPEVAATALVSQTTPDGVRILTVDHPEGQEEASWIVQMRDLRTGEALGAPMPHGEPVRRAEISPGGHLIAVAAGQGMQMWDGDTQTRLALLPHEAPVDDVVFSRDGKLLVTHSIDGVTQVWEARSGRPVLQLPLHAEWWTTEVSPDDKVLILITEDRTLRLWSLETGALLYEPVPDVASAELRGASGQLVTASENGVVRLLSSSGAARNVLVDTPSGVFDAAALSSDTHLAATAEAGALSVWDTATMKQVGTPLRSMGGPAVRLRFVDGDSKLAAILSGRAVVWDFRSGRIVAQAPLQPWLLPFDDVSPDGKKVVVVTSPALPLTFHVTDLATGRALTGPLTQRVKWSIPVPFSPDGRSLLLAATEGSVQVLDSGSGRVRTTLNPRAGRILSAVFSPDGHQVLTASDDRTSRLWDADSGQLVRSFTGPHGLSIALFTLDGDVLTIAEDTRVRLWNAADGKLRGEPLLTPVAETAALAPDGYRVLVLADDTASLWDSATGRPLGNPILPGGRIFDARFDPAGQRLFVVSQECLSVYAVPLGADRDADLLIRWATAVSGYTLEESGFLTSVDNTGDRLAALRRETAGAPLGQPATASLIRWFLMDPAQRPASPLAPPR
jgi:WD40 repeat protein